MRKRECKEVFFLFADIFLSRVVGVAFWRKNSAKMPISEMATVSNEAFALLLLENYWDTWSTKNLEAYQKEATFDERTNQKKNSNMGKIHNKCMGGPRDLEGGQRRGWISSMSCFCL